MERDGVIIVNYPKKPYLLYQIRSEDKKDISIYIGVTKNYFQRCYKHSNCRKYNKYKDQPLYTWMNDVIDNKKLKVKIKIIEENFSEEEVFEREKELIWMYRYNHFNVLNISDGGKGNLGGIPWNKGRTNVYSQEQINNLSKAHIGISSGKKGKFLSEETKKLISLRNKERKASGWINPKKVIVYKYDINNVLLNTYIGLQEASIKEKASPTSIGRWCRKMRKPKNEFIWSYSELS